LYAKLSERARLVTVAHTSSPMPNGRPLFGANGAAEFASSAIAFRDIKPVRKDEQVADAAPTADEAAHNFQDAALRHSISTAVWSGSPVIRHGPTFGLSPPHPCALATFALDEVCLLQAPAEPTYPVMAKSH